MPINDISLHSRKRAWPLTIALFGLIVGGLSTSLSAADSEAVFQKIQPRMVKIFGAGGLRNLHSYSTGFVVSEEGHIVTVWSHVLDTDEVTVILSNGRRETAVVLGAEPQLDLAVIKIQAEGLQLPYFDLEQSVTGTPGTRVLSFSNMFKVATGDEPLSLMHGVIAAKTKLTARRGAYEVPYDGPVYIVDAITNNPGSGGGLLTTTDGNLLAMVGKELRNNESNTWINYAIPIEVIAPVVKQIISGEYVLQEAKPTGEENPRNYKPLDFGFVMVPDVVFRTPAYIDVVQPESTAEKIGLLQGDLVLFVNDTLIQSCRELDEQLGFLEAGDDLALIVRRDNALVTVQTIVPRKDN